MSDKRLRFAVFGSGDFGPQFARYISELGDVVAVSDPDPDVRTRFVEVTGLDVAQYDNHETLSAS